MIDLSNPLTPTLLNEQDPESPRISLNEELLPFTVKLVITESDLQKAVLIRHAAYDRHVPLFAETLRTPEPVDKENGVVILLAEAKLNGQPLGTMRIQTNDFRPLNLEQSLRLPQWLQGQRLAEATRLGITEDRIGRVVKTALFKAYFQYCASAGVDSMVITARAPLDRQYDRLLFKDVYPGMGYIPLSHVGNMPHRVMALKVADVEPNWRMSRHPLYDYFFKICHPDIRANAGMSLNPAIPAKEEISELNAVAL